MKIVNTLTIGSLLAVLATGCASTHRPTSTVLPLPTTNEIVTITVLNSGFNADCFYKPCDKPHRALILLGGSEGGKSWSTQSAYVEQMVDAGYYVMSLAYFRAGGLPNELRAIPLEYFSRAFKWLSQQKEVIPDDYVLMGVSRGAELALLLATVYPQQVKAVIAIAPSSVVFPARPTGIFDALRQHSAWSLDGKELAFVPIPYSFTSLRCLISGKCTRMFEKALANARAVQRGSICVEKSQGPILLISFTQDQIWPSTYMSEQVLHRLHARGFGYACEHQAYPTTHSNWSIEPCWTRIMAFLKQTLGT